MNKLQFNLILVLFFFISKSTIAQTAYFRLPDPKNSEGIVFKGMITKYLLENESSFKWYNTNKKYFQPEASLLNLMDSSRGKFSFILFGGTWCDDSQSILPEFFKLQEMSGFPDSSVTFFGVDREKKILRWNI